MPAYQQLLKTSDAGIQSATEALMKALRSVDEFLALHGAGEGDYAVGPHYSWNMSQWGEEQVRLRVCGSHPSIDLSAVQLTSRVLS